MQADQLVEFVTVVRSGSLSSASIKLALSQSSLSRHMRELETSLGVQLLKRKSDGVELTEEGRYVFGRAANIADILDDINSHARHHKQLVRTFSIYGVAELPRYLRAFAQAISGNPNDLPAKSRFVRRSDLTSADIGGALAQGEVDIAVLRPTELLADFNDRFSIAKFRDEGVVAMIGPSHPLSKRPSICVEDPQGCLLLHADSHYDQARHAWLEFKALLRAHHVDYQAESCELLSASDWFMAPEQGIVPLSAAHSAIPLLREMGRVCVPIKNARYTYYTVHRPQDAFAYTLIKQAQKALAPL